MPNRIEGAIAKVLVAYPLYCWLAAIAAACVAGAVDRGPGTPALVICLWWALPDVLVARWLTQNDSHALRKPLLVAVHLATAAFKLAISSLGFAFVLDFVLRHAAPAWFVPGMADRLMRPCIIGHILSLLLGLGSVVTALLVGQKLWSSGGMLTAVADDQWPPVVEQGFNWSILFLLEYAVFAAAVVITVIYENSFGRTPIGKLGPQPPLKLAVLSAASIIATVGTGLLTMLIWRRIIARTANECWPGAITAADDYDPRDSLD